MHTGRLDRLYIGIDTAYSLLPTKKGKREYITELSWDDFKPTGLLMDISGCNVMLHHLTSHC
jgi:hypothetical protein